MKGVKVPDALRKKQFPKIKGKKREDPVKDGTGKDENLKRQFQDTLIF